MEQYFSISDKLGGTEQLILKLASFYKKQDKDVSICFFKKKTNTVWEELGFNVFYCNNSIRLFYLFCKSKKFHEIFSSHLMINSLLGILRTIGCLSVNRLVCRESTVVFERYKKGKLLQYKLAYYLGYRNIDILITQTDAMRKKLLEELPYLNKRMDIRTIPNPFEFPTKPVTAYSTTYPYVVSAGRLIPEKGFEDLILAFNLLKKDFPDFKLIILGEGYLRKKIENKITILGLDNEIILKGFVEDVYSYFKGAKLCVVSSYVEGFPNVLLQMMSQNGRVVSTLCAGGINELEGVVVCQPKKFYELYMSMRSTIESDKVYENRNKFDKELKKRDIYQFISLLNEK